MIAVESVAKSFGAVQAVRDVIRVVDEEEAEP